MAWGGFCNNISIKINRFTKFKVYNKIMLLKKYLKRTMNCDTTAPVTQNSRMNYLLITSGCKPDERMGTLSAVDENVYQKLTSNDIS